MASTVQTRTVRETLARLGHATNAQVHEALPAHLGDLSLTSLHRITARLVERGEIGTVTTGDRTMMLDARPEAHDHFVCTSCGGIVDIAVPAPALAAIQEQIGAHLADGGLVVRGRCAVCIARTAGHEPQFPDSSS